MSFLSSFFKKKTIEEPVKIEQTKKHEITIYIDSVSVRVVGFEYFDNSKKNFSWHEEKFLGPYEGLSEGDPVKNIFTALPKAISEMTHRLEGQEKVKCCISMDGAFVGNITAPKVDMYQKLLQAEMKKIVPIPFNEVMFASNKVIENSDSNSYFCLALQKTMYDNYVSIFKSFGLDVYVELQIFSLARFISQDGLFRCVVFINDLDTYIILCKGSMVIDFVTLKSGYNDVVKNLSKNTGLDLLSAKKLVASKDILEKTKRKSAEFVTSATVQFEKEVSQEIFHTIQKISEKYNLKLESILLSGNSDVANIYNNIKIESENGLKIESISLIDFFDIDANLSRNEISRYTHCFGLAKLSS